MSATGQHIHTHSNFALIQKSREICEYLCGVIVFLWCSVRPNEISSETTCKVRPHNQFFFHFCCECLCVNRSIPSYHYGFALHFNMRFYGSLIQKEVLMLFDVLLLCSSFTILQIFCSSSFSGETLFFSFNEQIMNKK